MHSKSSFFIVFAVMVKKMQYLVKCDLQYLENTVLLLRFPQWFTEYVSSDVVIKATGAKRSKTTLQLSLSNQYVSVTRECQFC